MTAHYAFILNRIKLIISSVDAYPSRINTLAAKEKLFYNGYKNLITYTFKIFLGFSLNVHNHSCS